MKTGPGSPVQGLCETFNNCYTRIATQAYLEVLHDGKQDFGKRTLQNIFRFLCGLFFLLNIAVKGSPHCAR